MGKFIDLTGKKFGKLTVIKRMPNNKFGVLYWLCQCECGEQTIVRGNRLKSGHTKSCGCIKKEKASLRGTKKRIYKKEFDRLRKIFKGMKNRCYNPNTNNYNRYGAKGIIICNEWLNKPLNFCEWAIANGYKNNLTIDRINPNGNYEPSNCRWVNYTEQCRNRKITLKFTINNITKSLAEWCDIYKIKYSAVFRRLKRGWNIEKSLTQPLRIINYQNRG